MTRLHLTKHHALGNDFLVLIDLGERHPVDAGLARRLCDRHRGVGADGLLRAVAGTDGSDVTMQLRNADGGEAETSGNGVRCLAQAVVDAGVVEGPHVAVGTAAGLHRLSVVPGGEPGTAQVTADMGAVRLGPERSLSPGQRSRAVDMGNPHVVVLGPDPEEVDLEALASSFDGVNVEVVGTGPGSDAISMRVWERGVGETLACGTGACAAAAAAHDWGLVGNRVLVHQPGGAVQVDVEPDTVVLSGAVERVADIEVDVP